MEGAKTACDYCGMPISAMSIASATESVLLHLRVVHGIFMVPKREQ